MTAVPPEDVRAALHRLTKSEAFGKAERPARFLTHLVETALAGHPHILKESVLGCDVFQRPPSWDPRLDPIVRQEAARLRKRIARYYEEFGADEPVRIGLPVGTYVPTFVWSNAPQILASNGVAALPLAPVQTTSPKKRLWFAAALLLFIALSVAGGLFLWFHGTPGKSLSLAVLPFQNATGDPADEYFSDGITDEMADSIGRFKNLRVLPHTEVFKFKKSAQTPKQIGASLAASHLLQGKVERSGDSIEIIASLVRAADGNVLWTNSYRRHSADLSAVEAEIAVAVGTSLRLTTPAFAVKHNPPPDAHDAYLKGRFEANQTTVEANAKAQQFFRRAIELDPEYAYAYQALGAAIWNENIWAGTSPDIGERRKSEELWLKAVQLDPDFMLVHSSLGAYAMQYDWDWPRAEREFQAVAAAGDNMSVEENYALLCLIRGQRREAERHMERAVQLDPEGNGRIANTVNLLQLEGRLPEAETECRKWLSRTQRGLGPKLALAAILAGQQKTSAALQILQSLPPENPTVRMALAQVIAMSGDRQQALRLMAPFEQTYRERRVFMYDFAVAYAALGDAPNAAKWMERSMNAREGPALYIRVDPQLAKVQTDPAFRALKLRMNLDW